WSMYVYSDVAAASIEIARQLQRHLTTTTADIKHTLIGPQRGKRTHVTHKLRTRRLKATERPDIPAQVQRRQIRLAIQRAHGVIQRPKRHQPGIPHSSQQPDRVPVHCRCAIVPRMNTDYTALLLQKKCEDSYANASRNVRVDRCCDDGRAGG